MPAMEANARIVQSANGLLSPVAGTAVALFLEADTFPEPGIDGPPEPGVDGPPSPGVSGSGFSGSVIEGSETPQTTHLPPSYL